MTDTMVALLSAGLGLAAGAGIWWASRRREGGEGRRLALAVEDESAPLDDLSDCGLMPPALDDMLAVAEAAGVMADPQPTVGQAALYQLADVGLSGPVIPAPLIGAQAPDSPQPSREIPDLSALVDLGGRRVHPQCVRDRTDGRWGRICAHCGPILVGPASTFPGRSRDG